MPEMKLIMESWRLHQSEETEGAFLVEEIWSGAYITHLILLEDQRRLLEEGIGQFFSNAFNAVKGKVEQFATWAESKLMSFVDAAIKKIQTFFENMRTAANKWRSELLQKIFTKNSVRDVVESLGVLRRTEYLKFGASILATLLAKLSELGANAVLDAMSAGGATAVKIAAFVSENIEKIKLFVEAIKTALDPTGILGLLEKIPAYAESAEILLQLKRDLQDPLRGLKNLST
jgi:hypothetical protein